MIKKLNHRENIQAEKINHILQASYTIEAEIIDAIDFPPLRRTLADIRNKPACQLYLSCGFKEVNRWETPDGYQIIRFEKTRDNTNGPEVYK